MRKDGNWLQRRRELAKLRAEAGPSTYENRHFAQPEPEDHAPWVKLAEMDPVTGRWTWHGHWRPFGQTPLMEWRLR
jgi:hypothetical protein